MCLCWNLLFRFKKLEQMVLLNSNMKINGKFNISFAWLLWIYIIGMLAYIWIIWWSWLAHRTTIITYEWLHGRFYTTNRTPIRGSFINIFKWAGQYSIRTTETAKTMAGLVLVRRHWFSECKFEFAWTIEQSEFRSRYMNKSLCVWPCAPTGPASVGGRHSSEPPRTTVGVWMEPVNNNGEI